MTPAINAAKNAKIPFQIHEYKHDDSAGSYGEEAAIKLNVDGKRVFKTLVVSIDDEKLSVGVIPVACQLDLKRFAKALGAKKAAMAQAHAAEKTTGYVLGGISPLGQKKPLVTLIDESSTGFDTIFVSAGRRGLEIELSPADLCLLTKGKFESICK